MALSFDPTPVQLRSEDLADEIPSMLIELADTMRAQSAELTYLLAVVADTSRDVGRRIYLAEAQGRAALETASRAQLAVETLTRTLRAAGRI